ncbi:AraC family transcriptional regulator [Nostoc sp. 3335mG]|nr:AraC family transcriptional regulator [Nostoc sp. 3335mG]
MTDWLFSSGRHSRAANFSERERLSFRHGNTRAYLEEIQVFPGVWLYRSEATPNCQFNIEVQGGRRGEGRLVLGAILSSRGVMDLEGGDERAWRDDGRAYVMTPVERWTRYKVDSQRGWRAVSLRLERDALDLIAGENKVPELFIEALERGREDLLDVAMLPGNVRAVAQDLLRLPYQGAMGTLYCQAKSLEFLAHQFAMIERKGQDEEALPPRDLAKVRMARDRLMADLRDPPDLETLARDVGLSPKRLNRGFRDLFGNTVFAYLRDARLDAARKALAGGSPLPLKQLAWELGYAQVSNFVTAFRRRFGVTPGAFREGED